MCLSDETAGMVYLSEAEVGLPKVEHERLLAPLQKVLLPLLLSYAHLVATT
jgi:hypothetical protein